MGSKRPCEPHHSVPSSTVPSTSDIDVVVLDSPSPTRARDLLSQLTAGGGEGGQGTRPCRVRRRSPPSLSLSLCLGPEEEDEEPPFMPAPMPAPPRPPTTRAPASKSVANAQVDFVGEPPFMPRPDPRQASVVIREPAPHLRRAASCAPPPKHTAPVPPPPPQRRPGTPAPHTFRDLQAQLLPQPELTSRVVGGGDGAVKPKTAAQREEGWWASWTTSSDDCGGREAWLSHHGLLAGQAVQWFSSFYSAAVAGPGPTMRDLLQQMCVEVGFACPACRCRPANVVPAPRTHLCLCFQCEYIFRDDPALACPVCAAVRAWGIRA